MHADDFKPISEEAFQRLSRDEQARYMVRFNTYLEERIADTRRQIDRQISLLKRPPR